MAAWNEGKMADLIDRIGHRLVPPPRPFTPVSL
jgi:hypothetical protein